MTNLTITATEVALVPLPGVGFEQFTGPAAEAINAGQYVRFDTTTGKITKGNASTAAEARDGGVAINTAAAGQTVTAVRLGLLEVGAALDSLDYDADVFLSDTDGTLADSAGTVSKVVGTVYPGWGETTPDKLLRVDMGVSAELPAGAVGTTALADDSVTKAKLAAGTGTKIALIAGGAAGNHTVTGIATADEIIYILHISTAASVATIADLTSEFTISAANTINNAAGTDTTSDQLLVFYNDLT